MRTDHDIWPPYSNAEQWRVDYDEDEGEREDETEGEEGKDE